MNTVGNWQNASGTWDALTGAPDFDDAMGFKIARRAGRIPRMPEGDGGIDGRLLQPGPFLHPQVEHDQFKSDIMFEPDRRRFTSEVNLYLAGSGDLVYFGPELYPADVPTDIARFRYEPNTRPWAPTGSDVFHPRGAPQAP